MEEFQKQWIDSIEKETIEWTKKLGTELADKKLTTSQLRKFFGEVKRIENKSKDASKNITTDIAMLKPLLYYTLGRELGNKESKDGFQLFATTISSLVEIVLEKKDSVVPRFRNFVKIFESIVAYHKYQEKLEEIKAKEEKKSKGFKN